MVFKLTLKVKQHSKRHSHEGSIQNSNGTQEIKNFIARKHTLCIATSGKKQDNFFLTENNVSSIYKSTGFKVIWNILATKKHENTESPFIGGASGISKSSEKAWARNSHNRQWLNFAGQQDVKKLIRGHRKGLTDRLLSLGKSQGWQVVSLTTRHGLLRKVFCFLCPPDHREQTFKFESL